MNANITLASVLESTAGRFVTVTFTKKDGHQPHQVQDADRPLTAALRCYVASQRGDEIEVPNELL